MQLLNSMHTQLQPPTDKLNKRLLDVLEDIVNNIEIKSDFSIRHQNYKPSEIPAETIDRFQKLPDAMQEKYLSLQLQKFLYGVYYNGSIQSETATEETENKLPLDLENNTALGVDLAFYDRLHESNAGNGYFQPGWLILKEESDGSLAVIKNGLRLHIRRNKHLQPSEREASIGDIVAVKMPKNIVQNGFYLAVGNAGLYRSVDKAIEHRGITVRIYFNLTPSGAVAVMGRLTNYLNEANIPFQLKFLYNPKDYKRHDSGVLYVDKQDYQLVNKFLNSIYLEHQTDFKLEIPLFTKQLAPGLGLAEEPDQKFRDRESFGMNRCQIIANALLEVWYRGKNTPTDRMRAIFDHFSNIGISLEQVYLNANSEDIYTCLDYQQLI
ncbi:T3SS effector HopA1 family protein [Calothrix sp. PCC 6303]|uniref:T3SS effector HopA1 family protein n=1 Tax=Calothrix sp. PCC 6303 TaxID=1170562 RepID=UPI0002A03C38|nr:T3SS effector HopA1 family protein [Calothrix sp. PCC 6303]AFZ01492.1 hypothetical protein Cal6303_2500 [Calothrix sp. PCC 6303]